MNEKLINYLKENPVDLTDCFSLEEHDPYKINLSDVIKFDYSNDTLKIDESVIEEICDKIENQLIDDFYNYNIDNFLESTIINLGIKDNINADDYKDFIETNVDKDSILEEYKLTIDFLLDQENLNTESDLLLGSIDNIVNFIKCDTNSLEDIDAITKMLFKSQNYRIEHLRHPKGNFLKSFIEEVNNSGFYTPLVYTFTREMSLKDLKDLLKQEFVAILPDEPFGLFDPVNGGGSMMEISLERTFNIPLSYVYLSNVNCSSYGYATSSVYGDLI